jgi:hypothetical protein
MGDVWNPFDPNNPVYVEVAKKTRSTRKRVQKTTLALSGLAIVYYISKSGAADGWFNGLGNGRVNQFGVIRRK